MYALCCWCFFPAAIARKVYLRPGRGIGGLSKAFGTKARRGTLTNIHRPASTGVIRHILQQLEELKVSHAEGRYADSVYQIVGKSVSKFANLKSKYMY